jgi:hypothetical protein
MEIFNFRRRNWCGWEPLGRVQQGPKPSHQQDRALP